MDTKDTRKNGGRAGSTHPSRAISPTDMDAYEYRKSKYWPKLVGRLKQVYGNRPDLAKHLSTLETVCSTAWRERDPELKDLDLARPSDTLWYTESSVVGTSVYVDLFAGDLDGLRSRLDYLNGLGINYVHIMPIFRCPEGNSDGGYAVSSFRDLDPKYGRIEALRSLCAAMREKGMALVVDFIFNHTSDEHPWALQAKQGDARYQNFYRVFDSTDIVEAYQRTLREIFPTIRRGSFTWEPEMSKWVWTSFNSFQWDLNYDNPDLFVAMVDEMLFLANCGIDVLRFDAVAFIWKRLGTDCENLPEAHLLIQAFNLVCRIAAPAVVFKSEAIVHPDDVRSYIDAEECQLSYNPNLMALLWEAAATRQTKLLRKALSHRQALPHRTTWVNYLRCHDDIGWCFDDGDAARVGINAFEHRKFLNRFYSGQFEGSFARGVPFQFNPDNEDMRICGTLASLVGVEDALEKGDALHLKMSLARARMLFGVLFSIGGIPLVYMGEELGLLNDYTYEDDPDKRGDSRWVHRIPVDWSKAPGGANYGPVEAGFYEMLSRLSRERSGTAAISGTQIELLEMPNEHVLAYRRPNEQQSLVVVANFSEKRIKLAPLFDDDGMPKVLHDQLSDTVLTVTSVLEPYAIHWLVAD